VTDTRPRDKKNEWYKSLLEAEYERDPTNGRTVFYLANTYREMGMVDEAITKYHEKLTLPGQWIEEVVLSRHHLLVLYLREKSDIDRAIEQAEAIRSSGRMRAEPFYELCRHYRETGNLVEAAKYLLLAQVRAYQPNTLPPPITT
jgi:tetratricopeptide (TPR) repeat protein